MQKKLIMLATAGLLSTPLMAQSSLQVYGLIDMGVSHLGNSKGGALTYDDDDELQTWSAPLSNRTGIDSGLQSANRLGFQGTERLGNGLDAFFNIEMGFTGDAGSAATENRQTYVGLGGDFGRISLGRQWNPSRQFIGRIDPFDNDFYAAIDNFRLVQRRVDNALVYASPKYRGFSVDVAFSRNASGDEEYRFGSADRTDQRFFSITPTYDNGPWTVGLSYQQERVRNPNVQAFDDGQYGLATFPLLMAQVDFEDIDSWDDIQAVDRRRAWDIGTAYDFGPVELSGLYGHTRFQYDGDRSADTLKQWMLGMKAPVGEQGTFMLSYQDLRYDISQEDRIKAAKWSIGYTHALSTRTNLYATYSHLHSNVQELFTVDRLNAYVNTYDGEHDEVMQLGGYRNALAVGIRHQF